MGGKTQINKSQVKIYQCCTFWKYVNVAVFYRKLLPIGTITFCFLQYHSKIGVFLFWLGFCRVIYRHLVVWSTSFQSHNVDVHILPVSPRENQTDGKRSDHVWTRPRRRQTRTPASPECAATRLSYQMCIIPQPVRVQNFLKIKSGVCFFFFSSQKIKIKCPSQRQANAGWCGGYLLASSNRLTASANYEAISCFLSLFQTFKWALGEKECCCCGGGGGGGGVFSPFPSLPSLPCVISWKVQCPAAGSNRH